MILNFVDKMHWTFDKALTIGFLKRSDITRIKADRKKLKDFKICIQSRSNAFICVNDKKACAYNGKSWLRSDTLALPGHRR